MLDALVVAHRNRWGHVEELLATIAEGLDALIRITVKVNDPKGKAKLGPPFSYPRPGQPLARKRSVRPADLARRLLAGR